MDQVTKVDNHYMTREFLETQLVENKERIANLESHIQTVTSAHMARLQSATVCVTKCKSGPWKH
jgi:hypothetical protein